MYLPSRVDSVIRVEDTISDRPSKLTTGSSDSGRPKMSPNVRVSEFCLGGAGRQLSWNSYQLADLFFKEDRFESFGIFTSVV